LTPALLSLIHPAPAAAYAAAAGVLLTAVLAELLTAAWRPERNSMTAEVRAMPRPDPEEEPDDAPKILRLKTAPKGAKRKREPLFYIDDTEYSVEVHPSPARSLKYLKMLRDEGADIATQYMLESLLGDEGYQALMEYEDLTEEQFEQVVTAASKIMLGSFEGPKEQQKKPQRRPRGSSRT
jgi:hypothetical protein